MILVDTNVLVYAVNEEAAAHQRAERWLRQALVGTETVGFAWNVLLGFVRVSTLRAAFPRPLDASTALDLVDDWLAATHTSIVHPTAQHASLLRNLLGDLGTAGNLVQDAHLAALSIEHRASICSFDRDFQRFRGVKVFLPDQP